MFIRIPQKLLMYCVRLAAFLNLQCTSECCICVDKFVNVSLNLLVYYVLAVFFFYMQRIYWQNNEDGFLICVFLSYSAVNCACRQQQMWTCINKVYYMGNSVLVSIKGVLQTLRLQRRWGTLPETLTTSAKNFL